MLHRKWRRLDFVGILLVGLGLFSEKTPRADEQVNNPPIEFRSPSYDDLYPVQRQEVDRALALGHKLYGKRDYRGALRAVQRIFVLVPNYKDAREIETYCKDALKTRRTPPGQN